MMEDSIGTFRKTLTAFCNQVQSSCDALKQSVERRPTPLNSASSTFIQCLNRRVSSTSADLNMLESMSFDTVSFEELLGHCSEVYKKNQTDLLDLQDRLINFGYTPENDISVDDEIVAFGEPMSPAGSDLTIIQEDLLWEEDSFNLQDLGLSDVCLKTVAAEGEVDDELMPSGVPTSIINVQKEEYESLPSYMRTLASWEDLLAAVEKINSSLNVIFKEKGSNFFHQDELASMELGAKGRCYLLLLVRLNCLVVETVDGVIFYKVV
ncbi:uncharacterized protein LOC124945224 [Impatiens glandulifera]|uniref:uncharacterized protein LOC124945224 n=1 Tax=Impatiens glandulifera TaxID=253017 RepID=UPI001FB079B8|nr:uncharacterized protein LOC124945224 [Impatiens glandulifera]